MNHYAQCRWCGRNTILTSEGRCGDCDLHYKKSKTRGYSNEGKVFELFRRQGR